MKKVLFLACLLCTLMSCNGSGSATAPDTMELDEIYSKHQVKGCFLLQSIKSGQVYAYNKDRCETGFLPASTFKIVNSIVALETGVAADENLVIEWDSVVRQVPTWNKDHTMSSAFSASCVPYYQELAARIGTMRMQEWVNKLQYGKMDIRDETLTNFWLKGNSKITPNEQLDFLGKLAKEELPIKPSTLFKLKEIMTLASDSSGLVMRGKTGWAIVDGLNIGWFVGFIERPDGERFIFVNNVEAPVGALRDDDFMMCRKSIVGEVLSKMGVI